MFLSIALYFICIFLIWWAYCGYIFVFYLFSLFADTRKTSRTIREPHLSVSILIPCYNEEPLVKKKVDNIKALDYPRDKLRVYFLDGVSSDKTLERLTEECRGHDYLHVVETNVTGKINQLNTILTKIDTDIIVNTDMDALMKSDSLLKIVREFQDNQDVSLVGARVSPLDPGGIEGQYWETQNWLRIIESKVVSSSIVVAPCYAFRSALFWRFPDDCVADDIFISFFVNFAGKKTVYLEDALVYEGRTSQTIEQFITHKFRKANAYLTELLRFFYLLPKADGKRKTIYLTKVLQVAVIPWILVFFFLASISFLLSGMGTVQVVLFAIIFLGISLATAHILVRKGIRSAHQKNIRTYSSILIFLIVNLILIMAGITYPFLIQTSRYPKIDHAKD